MVLRGGAWQGCGIGRAAVVLRAAVWSCWCSVLRGGVVSFSAVWALEFAVLRGFLSKVPFLDFFPVTIILCIFNPSSHGVRVCVCLFKMGLKNVSQ